MGRLSSSYVVQDAEMMAPTPSLYPTALRVETFKTQECPIPTDSFAYYPAPDPLLRTM